MVLPYFELVKIQHFTYVQLNDFFIHFIVTQNFMPFYYNQSATDITQQQVDCCTHFWESA